MSTDTLLTILIGLIGLQTFLMSLGVIYLINIHSDIHGGKR